MDTTSPSLLLRVREPGNRAAWERFYLYTPLLYHWVRRLGLKNQDADDLVQEVFTALVWKLPQFQYDRDGKFRAWLRTVARNICIDHFRRQGNGLAAQEPLPDVAVPAEIESVWESEYRQHLVHQALRIMQRDFEPSTWRACWGMVVDGQSGAEVAAELMLSLPAVHQASSRVLRRLREELAGLLD